jgi:hypothetical protein
MIFRFARLDPVGLGTSLSTVDFANGLAWGIVGIVLIAVGVQIDFPVVQHPMDQSL